MTLNLVKWACLAGVATLVSACGGASSGQDSENESSVALNYDMSAYLSQNIQQDARDSLGSHNSHNSNGLTRSGNFTSDQILRGQLSATVIGGANDGQVEVFPWTIYLDEDTLQVSSNSTLTLDPGNYDFELLLTKGEQQYAGYANQSVIDGENDIAMTIKPIIGDLIDDVTIIDRLAYFKFKYALSDLAALASPSIGIQVDGSAEQVFTINTQTGLTNAFVNLPTGAHNLALKLYNASVQVGRSIVAQENQVIAYGTDLAMDIVPLHGELQFVLTEDGGDANLSVNLPAEVVDEVGGVNNLTATLALVGVKNPLQETALMFIQQPNGDYQADVVLTDLQYEDVTVSMTFTDATTSDQIAACNHAWTLNNQNQAFTCDITLIRRAVVNSAILAVLGINVENQLGEPVAGAVITNANGDTLGVTGSGTYGTSGYLKVYLGAGDHDLTATDLASGETKTTTVSLSPLEVENVMMTLEAPAPTNPTINGFTDAYDPANWAISGVAGYTMDASQFFITVGSGGGGKTASITIPASGTISFDWAMNVISAGQYGDSIKYAINGTVYNLSTAGTASGSESGISVQAGDVFEFQTWGTTQSSSYNATFNNFVFEPALVINGFTGNFAAANWQPEQLGLNYSVSQSELVLSTTTGVDGGGYLYVPITTDGVISFDYNILGSANRISIAYEVRRGPAVPSFDQIHEVGYATSGSYVNIPVQAGDYFYIATSISGVSSDTSFTMSNFVFTGN